MSTENLPTEEDLPEQLRIRREKRASLLERNVEPYPVSVPRTKSLKEIREKYVGLEIDVMLNRLQVELFSSAIPASCALQLCVKAMEPNFRRCCR
jgi:lysyl-tRNA synthetase class II